MSMRLAPTSLVISHRSSPGGATVAHGQALIIQTCQRTLIVGQTEEGQRGFARYEGADAYRLLLEITCGLRSELEGETNVFGQIKRAWQEHQEHKTKALEYWFQRLFRDAKRIRTKYLQGLGGQSYGSLCRRLLSLPVNAPLGIVGSGDLAHSLVGFFCRHPLTVFARDASRASFEVDVATAPLDSIEAYISELRALIICIPSAPEWEGSLLHLLRGRDVSIIHLGHRDGVDTPLRRHPKYASLDGIFRLRRQQNTVRSLKIAAARRACAIAAERVLLPSGRAAEGHRAA